jgi:SAM-dependent methyltransferase
VANKRDWAEKDLKKHLIDERRFLWRRDTLDRIASSMELRHGHSLVDVGCGLGYLGWTMFPYYGTSGSYTGIDCSIRLLREAVELSEEWSGDGEVHFIRGSAISIPIMNGFADLAMCQTLLMHLPRPEEALAEMVRITKPGGRIMCMEPDNSSTFELPAGSMDSMGEDQLLWLFRNRLKIDRGRRVLGRGDWSIGRFLPKMMSDAGLVDIDARHNDAPRFLQPPYETDAQRFRLEKILEYSRKNEMELEEESRARMEESKDFFLAGGGSLSTWYRMRRFMKRWGESGRPILREQAESGELWYGMQGSHFYCVTGKVPE